MEGYLDVTCPLCGGEVDYVDEYDSHYDSPNEYVAYVKGACKECEASLLWKEIYKLHAIVDLKEEK